MCDELDVWHERKRWVKHDFSFGQPQPHPLSISLSSPRRFIKVTLQTKTVLPVGGVWIRNVPPTIYPWASFLRSLSRQRELNSPLAGRHSKGTFPRIVSNRKLLKMKPDFIGHILERKAINRLPQECCHAEIGREALSLAQQHSQEVRNRTKQSMERKSFHWLALVMKKKSQQSCFNP